MATASNLPTGRSSGTSPVADTSNDDVLPLDLLYDILLRLPAQTIGRFRAVCRSWQSVLCHPDFIAAARNPGPLIAIGMCNTNEVNVLDLESGDAIKRVKVATNNVLSLGAISHDCQVCVLDRNGQLCLLDLTSGVVSILPDLTPPPQQEGFPYTFYNVGRAASTRELKLLAVSTSVEQHQQQLCNILTLSKDDGGWRGTGHPPLNVEWQTRGCAVINGIAYFLSGYSADSMEMEPHAQKVMAFDFKSEAWAASLGGPSGKHPSISLAEIDSHLVAGCADRVAPSFEIELWFLVESYWSKRYTITMTSRQNHRQCYDYFVKPLAVLEDGRIVLWMHVVGVGENNMMRIYEPRTKTFMDGTLVSNCRSVGVFMWNLLHSEPRGAIDMAAKNLLINRCHHLSRASPSMEGPNKEL
ncbi:hypothetical protein ACQ4PT_013115 [Festuca glaucescens]